MSVYSQDYYWHKDAKVFVKKSDHKNFYLFFDANKAIENLEVNSKRVFNKELHWALGKFEGSEFIEYVSPAVINSYNDTLNFSNLFYVRLKDEKDVELLEKMAKETKVEILGNNEFMPRWFTLSCSKNSKGNALEMANLFYESRLFSVTEVDFLIRYSPNCVNDTYFSDQWNLKNTGQYGGTSGIDINLCAARTLTTGSSSIIVAVLDDGIQKNHPDLTNIHSNSFDTRTKLASQLRGRHGTAVAGIIGASTNTIVPTGIAGIAPNCRLMSISDSMMVAPNAAQELADGLNWAWKTGQASVINNSWGNNMHLQYPNHTMIVDAIDSALIRGRNGKGCVVVFSVGNENDTIVNFPARSRPDIIAVGAMSPCGQRKRSHHSWIFVPYGITPDPDSVSCDTENGWGSNYGVDLDIMAPGVLIPTTDLTGNDGYNPNFPIHTRPQNSGTKRTSDYTNKDYTVWFNGTSAAAPHISGVAALMLSVNPHLTQKQVKKIIEQTARKLPGYTYDYNNPARPNGGWNNQVGYGLVDAYKAVKKTDCYVSGVQPPPPSTFKRVECDVIEVWDATVPAGTRLELKATKSVIINPGFVVNSGATFIIE